MMCKACDNPIDGDEELCDACFQKALESRRAKLQAQVEAQGKDAPPTPAQLRARKLAEEMTKRRFNSGMGADNGSDWGNNSTGMTDMKGPMKIMGLDEDNG